MKKVTYRIRYYNKKGTAEFWENADSWEEALEKAKLLKNDRVVKSRIFVIAEICLWESN